MVYDSVTDASVNRLTFCTTIQKCHGSLVKIQFGYFYIYLFIALLFFFNIVLIVTIKYNMTRYPANFDIIRHA